MKLDIIKLTWPVPFPPMGLSYKTFKRKDDYQKRVYVTFLYSQAIVIKEDYETQSIYADYIITTYTPSKQEIQDMWENIIEEHTKLAKENWYILDYTKILESKHLWKPKPF